MKPGDKCLECGGTFIGKPGEDPHCDKCGVVATDYYKENTAPTCPQCSGPAIKTENPHEVYCSACEGFIHVETKNSTPDCLLCKGKGLDPVRGGPCPECCSEDDAMYAQPISMNAKDHGRCRCGAALGDYPVCKECGHAVENASVCPECAKKYAEMHPDKAQFLQSGFDTGEHAFVPGGKGITLCGKKVRENSADQTKVAKEMFSKEYESCDHDEQVAVNDQLKMLHSKGTFTEKDIWASKENANDIPKCPDGHGFMKPLPTVETSSHQRWECPECKTRIAMLKNTVTKCEKCGKEVADSARDLDWYGDEDDAFIGCKECGQKYPKGLKNAGRFKLGDVVRMTKTKQDSSLWRGDDVICSIVTVYEPGNRFDYQLKVRVKGDSNTGSTEVKESEIELANAYSMSSKDYSKGDRVSFHGGMGTVEGTGVGQVRVKFDGDAKVSIMRPEQLELENAAYKGARVYSRINPTDHGTVVETDGDAALVDWDGSGKSWIGQRDLVRMEKTNAASDADIERYLRQNLRRGTRSDLLKAASDWFKIPAGQVDVVLRRMEDELANAVKACPSCGASMVVINPQDSGLIQRKCTKCGEETMGEEGLREYKNSLGYCQGCGKDKVEVTPLQDPQNPKMRGAVRNLCASCISGFEHDGWSRTLANASDSCELCGGGPVVKSVKDWQGVNWDVCAQCASDKSNFTQKENATDCASCGHSKKLHSKDGCASTNCDCAKFSDSNMNADPGRLSHSATIDGFQLEIFEKLIGTSDSEFMYRIDGVPSSLRFPSLDKALLVGQTEIQDMVREQEMGNADYRRCPDCHGRITGTTPSGELWWCEKCKKSFGPLDIENAVATPPMKEKWQLKVLQLKGKLVSASEVDKPKILDEIKQLEAEMKEMGNAGDKANLERNVTEEVAAINLYEGQKCSADPKVAAVLDHIIKDEREHIMEFEETLKDETLNTVVLKVGDKVRFKNIVEDEAQGILIPAGTVVTISREIGGGLFRGKLSSGEDVGAIVYPEDVELVNAIDRKCHECDKPLPGKSGTEYGGEVFCLKCAKSMGIPNAAPSMCPSCGSERVRDSALPGKSCCVDCHEYFDNAIDPAAKDRDVPEAVNAGSVIARWESGKGKHWVELSKDASGYTYKTDSGGGVMEKFATDEDAIAKLDKDVHSFLMPDAAKVIKRVR